MIQHAGQYVREHPSSACPQVQSTLAKLSLCRTEALGARWYCCQKCQTLGRVYNSCGDRNCLACSGPKRAQWVKKTEQLLLEGVNYFQVVFTLPKALSRLALGNRRQIYTLLFRASWQAIEKSVREEQGYKAAAAMVLHTWNQQLEAHAHVHALIPGGGPSLLDPGGWKSTKRRGVDSPTYLVDASQLRRNYRDFFLAGLQRAYRRNELKLTGEFASLTDAESWDGLIKQLESTEWVAYIQPPPHADCKPEHVVRYLGRYLTGGPISDRRLISADDKAVVFWAREGTKTGGTRKQVQVKLTPVEFVRRWCLHILPKRYVKTRRFGGWSNKHRAQYLNRCEQLLNAQNNTSQANLDPLDRDMLEDTAANSSPCCPQCGQAMQLLESSFKPSWSTMRSRGLWPEWYQSKPTYQDTG